jgi:translation initiation factor 2 alpha subunit (eIF-2alpha)
MGQDLNQLINAGFNPLQVISEKTGRSMSDLKDDMAAGLITFSDVEDAFKDVTSEGGKFFKMMETQSATVGGRWSSFVDTVEQSARNIFKIVDKPVRAVVEGLNEAADRIEKLTRGEININVKGADGGGMGLAGKTALGVGALGLTGLIGIIITAVVQFFKKLRLIFSINLSKFLNTSGEAWGHLDDVDFDNIKQTKPKLERFKDAIDDIAKRAGKGNPILMRMAALVAKLVQGLFTIGAAIGVVWKAFVAAFRGILNVISNVLKSLATGAASLTSLIRGSLIVALGYWILKLRELNKEVNGLRGEDAPKGKAVKDFGAVPFGEDEEVTASFFKNLKWMLKGATKQLGKFLDMITQPLQDLAKFTFKELFNIQDFEEYKNLVKDGFGVLKEEAKSFFDNIAFIITGYDTAKDLFNEGPLAQFGEGTLNLLSKLFSDETFTELIESIDKELAIANERIRGTVEFENRRRGPAVPGLKDRTKARKRAEELQERERQRGLDDARKAQIDYLKELFSEKNFEIDISKAKAKILKNTDKFEELFLGFDFDLAGLFGIDATTPQEILDKLPKDIIPDIAAFIEQDINNEKDKIKAVFDEMSFDFDITQVKENLEKNKEKYNQFLGEFTKNSIFEGIESIDELINEIPFRKAINKIERRFFRFWSRN